MRHKLGLYLRVSTEEQAQVIEGSLDSQRHRLTGFVDLKNMQETGWGKIIETYVDEGLSAKDTKRPAFQRMIRDIKSEKINLILVTDLSRLSRNILDFCLLLEDLKKANAKFLSLKEQFDTSTPAGEMMVFNMINLAQFERKQTSERVSLNFHARALRGLRNGGCSILGYDADPNDPSKMIVNEQEAIRVRIIFQTFIETGSLSKSVDALEKDGIPPKFRKNRKEKNNHAGLWTTQTLGSLLRNRAYIGIREVNFKNISKDQSFLKSFEKYTQVKATWQPLIDKRVFENVQSILNINQKNSLKRVSQGKRRSFLLTGLLYCDDCGRPLVGSSGHGRISVSRYYVHRAIRTDGKLCSLRSINADKIESALLNHVDEMLFRENYLDSLEKRLQFVYEQTNQDHKKLLSQLSDRKSELDSEISNHIRLLTKMDGDELIEDIRKSLLDLKTKKISVDTQIEQTEEKLLSLCAKEDRQNIQMKAIELKAARNKATPAMMKRLFQTLFSVITLNKNLAKVSYWSGCSSSLRGDKNSKKMPSDEMSGGNPFYSAGSRKLEKLREFYNCPPLRGGGSDHPVIGWYAVKNGDPERIRTSDLMLRRHLLYPTELRDRRAQESMKILLFQALTHLLHLYS